MDLPEEAQPNLEDQDRRGEKISQKYNIQFELFPHGFECRTDFPEPQRIGELAQELYGLGPNHFNQLAGAIIRQYSRDLPPSVTHLGTKDTPINIKQLSFLGESMSKREFIDKNTNHELGHTVMFYEMVPILQALYPNQPLSQVLTHLENQVSTLRHSSTPLSWLDQIQNQATGRSFYDEGALFYEDLAEAFAVRMAGSDSWGKYLDFFARGTPQAQQAASEVLNVVDYLYGTAIKQPA